jgi:hypothetical protein
MPSGGAGTKMEKMKGKLTQQQREHLLNHHLGLSLSGDRLQVRYLLECENADKDKGCPLPRDASVFLCKRPPCPS